MAIKKQTTYMESSSQGNQQTQQPQGWGATPPIHSSMAGSERYQAQQQAQQPKPQPQAGQAMDTKIPNPSWQQQAQQAQNTAPPQHQPAATQKPQVTSSAPAPQADNLKKQTFTYAQMYEQLHPYQEPTAEDLEKERKRVRRNKMFAAIGDGISALSNLYFTTKGSPSAKQTPMLSDHVADTYQKMLNEREAKRQQYYNGYYEALKADHKDEREDAKNAADAAQKQADRDSKERIADEKNRFGYYKVDSDNANKAADRDSKERMNALDNATSRDNNIRTNATSAANNRRTNATNAANNIRNNSTRLVLAGYGDDGNGNGAGNGSNTAGGNGAGAGRGGRGGAGGAGGRGGRGGGRGGRGGKGYTISMGDQEGLLTIPDNAINDATAGQMFNMLPTSVQQELRDPVTGAMPAKDKIMAAVGDHALRYGNVGLRNLLRQLAGSDYYETVPNGYSDTWTDYNRNGRTGATRK